MVALIGWSLLGLAPAAAAILGAALASTDPIMLRGLIRRPGLAEPVRLALRLESGLNDAVLLPIIFVRCRSCFIAAPRVAPNGRASVLNSFCWGQEQALPSGYSGCRHLI